MMEAIEDRAARIGEARAAAVAERLAERARAAVPSVTVRVEAPGVTIAGRGLVQRHMRDPALAWLGILLR